MVVITISANQLNAQVQTLVVTELNLDVRSVVDVRDVRRAEANALGSQAEERVRLVVAERHEPWLLQRKTFAVVLKFSQLGVSHVDLLRSRFQ